MTQMQTTPRQGLPAWLVVLIILLVIAGGGWFVYDRIFSGRDDISADSIVVDPGPRRSPVQARHTALSRWGLGGPPQGILKRPNGQISARRGNAYLRAVPAKGSYVISFDYVPTVRRSWVTPAQWDLHMLALRALENNAVAQQLKVTADQKQKLRALPNDVKLTPAERTSLETMLKEWDKATGPAKDTAGLKLLQAINKLGDAHLADTKAAMLRRVQQIPTILTPEQIKQNAASPPATRPSR